MASEITSIARPTVLRVAGFACVAFGAVTAGVGATREWAAVGFAADTEGVADVAWNGIDAWEGKVVFFAAVVSLLLLIAMRISGSTATRRWLAISLVVLGALCIVLPVADAVRAEERFGGVEGADKLAHDLAVDSEFTEGVVREQLADLFEQDLRADLRPWWWVTALGGVLLVVGGVLSLLWVRRASRALDGQEEVV